MRAAERNYNNKTTSGASLFNRPGASVFKRRSHLKPIKNVVVMLKNHLQSLLAYFRHRITNAQSEGFNSRVQAIKFAARGFRSFENYRIRILFYCGKLNLLPETSH